MTRADVLGRALDALQAAHEHDYTPQAGLDAAVGSLADLDPGDLLATASVLAALGVSMPLAAGDVGWSLAQLRFLRSWIAPHVEAA